MIQMQKSDKQRCPSCNKPSLVLDENSGELACSTCGIVVTEKGAADGPEWRSFANDGVDKSRVGAGTSITMHDMGLSTIIGLQNKDASGTPLTANMKYLMKRLKTHDSRSKGSAEDRNLKEAFSELARLADKLSLNKATIDKAAYVYRKALESKLIRGRSINSVLVASVYASCRLLGVTRNLKDLEAVSNIKRKDIARCYRLLFQHLDIKADVIDPVQCISKIGSKLNISEKSRREAIRVINIAHEKDEVAGKDPMGLAAAALYLGCIRCDEDKTQRQIAMAANVTEVTIRNRFKGLKILQLVRK